MTKYTKIVLDIPVEIWFTLLMVSITFGFSWVLAVPIMMPSPHAASFVGIHYLIPVIGIFFWGLLAFFGPHRQHAWTFAIALPCYILVLWCHFNIKIWVPFINPNLYDSLYWNIDQYFRPFVEASYAARIAISSIISIDSNFYMTGFIAMFYISFSYHAIATPNIFRKLFVSALLFQGLGALSYLPFPAIGPFLYEQGIGLPAALAQQRMLETNGLIVGEGRDWLALNGSSVFTAGLGAMPSLHSGGAFLFFIYACRHARVLVPVYAAILSFILVTAVASRWHYLIDIPVGIGLAWLSIKLSDWLCRSSHTALQTPKIPSSLTSLDHAPHTQ